MTNVNSGEVTAADRIQGRFAPDHSIPNWRTLRATERNELRAGLLAHYGSALSTVELVRLDQAVDLLVRGRHARSDNESVRLTRCANHLLASIDAKHAPKPKTPLLSTLMAGIE